MATYTVEIRDQYGRLVTVLNNPLGKEFYLYRNKPGSLQFYLDAFDPQATDRYIKVNQYSAVIRRNGTPMFAGQISYLNPVVDETDKAQIQVTVTGYFDIFQNRMITSAYPNFSLSQLIFSATDCGQVIQTLVTDTQFPLYSDTTANLQGMTPTFCQSFTAPGTANINTLKLLLQNITLYTGIVTSATTNTLTDTGASWTTNQFAGGTVSIAGGTGAGQSESISSNTSNTITISASWPIIPDHTSTYAITPATPTTTGNMIIGIYQDFQGFPSNVLVANSQITQAVSGISATQGWKTFTYGGTKPALVSGQQYWIKAYLDTTQIAQDAILWSVLNPVNGVGYYPNGMAYSPESPSYFTSGQNLQFFIQLDDNSYQMTKNTYLGINIGTIQTSFNIDRTYNTYKIIKQAIEEISQLHSGIDFNISVQIDSNNLMTKYLNVFYPRQGIDNTDLNFIYPGNIIQINKSKDGKSMFNTIYARGQGTGVNQVTTTSSSPASSQTYGLREETSDYSDIPDSTTLQSIGDELIRIQQDPLEVPDIVLDGNSTPQLGSYGLGDTILIKSVGPGLLNFIEEFRIEEIHVTIDDDGREKVELTSSGA